jgi:hypothetical protein
MDLGPEEPQEISRGAGKGLTLTATVEVTAVNTAQIRDIRMIE